MTSYHGRYRSHEYAFAYRSDARAADVNVIAPDGGRFRFTLSVNDPPARRLPLRVVHAVCAWIDGSIKHIRK